MRLVERVETRADEVEGDGDEDAHEAVHQDAAACALLVLRGHVSLDDRLVRSVRDEVVGYAATNNSYPEADAAVVETPDEEPHLVVIDCQLPSSREAAFGVAPQIKGRKDSATNKDAALHDVAPDDRFHAAHRAIDDGDESHQDDAKVDVDARYCGQSKRRKIHHECHAGHHEDAEQRGGHHAGGEVEALLEYRVGRCCFESAEVG